MNVVALDDHVAEIDADAEIDLLIVGQAGIARGHPALNFGSASHGIDDTGELDEQAVPHQLDDAALVLGDLGLDELGAMGTKAGERAFLVGAHEARVANDVRAEDRGESALDLLRHGPPFARLTASLKA